MGAAPAAILIAKPKFRIRASRALVGDGEIFFGLGTSRRKAPPIWAVYGYCFNRLCVLSWAQRGQGVSH